MKSQPKMDEIEKAKKELILLYLGIKLRKESEVINIKLLLKKYFYLFYIGIILIE